MNIWVIGYGIPDNNSPTNGIFSYNQAKSISKLYPNINVCYIALDIRSLRRWRKWGIYAYQMQNMNIIECNIPIGNMPQFFTNYVYHKLMYMALKRAQMTFGNPDLIHAHFTVMAYTLAKLKHIWNVPVIVTEHSSGINKDLIDRKTFEMANIAYKNADKLIAVSPNFQKKISMHFNVDSIYIPNMINEEYFHLSYKKSKARNYFKFISVGRLVPVKNFGMLIKSFNEAFRHDESIKLEIIGDGVEKNKLVKLIRQYNRENQISLLGAKNNGEVAMLLQDSDCFVLTSNSETFGVVCAEALMCGLPVISTKCGGTDCMINNCNGMFVPVGDVKNLSNALQLMIKQYTIYNRANISKQAISQFSTKNVSEKIVSIYQSVIN